MHTVNFDGDTNISIMDKNKLTSRDLALIAGRIVSDVDFSKLEFCSLNSDYPSAESDENWVSLKLLYDVISQFIDDEPLPF